MKAREFIRQALQELVVQDAQAPIEAVDYADGLRILNAMLNQFASNGTNLWRTNKLIETEDIDNSIWTATNIAVSYDEVQSPSGSPDAWTLTPSGAAVFSQDVPISDETTYTQSVYLNAGTSFAATLNLKRGSNGVVFKTTAITVPTIWKAFSQYEEVPKDEDFITWELTDFGSGDVVDIWHPLLNEGDAVGDYAPGGSGYTNNVADIDYHVPIVDGAIWGVMKNLAVNIASQYGVPISPALAITATEGKRTLIKIAQKIKASQYPETLPKGSGNWQSVYESKPFYPTPS